MSEAWLSRALDDIGRLVGAAGYVSFVAALLLILRLRVLERIFSGLPRVYRLHHRLGALSFLLLLLHPLLLSLSLYVVSARAGAWLLVNLRNPAVLLGWISLFLLMAVMLATFALRLNYELWRYTHVVSALAFATATAHALLALNDTPARFRVALGGAALGGGALVYWEIVARVFRRSHLYRVAGVKHLSSKLLEIRLRPEKEPLPFEPGQFIYVSFHDDPHATHRCGIPRESHPFSISSAPEETELRLLVKALGDFTTLLQALDAGTMARVEGPYGRLLSGILQSDATHQIFLAGGIGITPFLSLLRSHGSEKLRADLHYFVNTREEAVFEEELHAIEKTHTGLRVFTHLAEKEGLPTLPSIERDSGPAASWGNVVLCGPPAMHRLLIQQLKRAGIPRRRIRSEEFRFL